VKADESKSFRLTERRSERPSVMGFNRRKMEDQRREAAEKEAANRRATEAQILEDAERLIAAWNERQAKRMPMLFSPTIGAAITAGYWFPLGALPGLPNNQCD
jgi:beta-phosphoglucomutase-like phosphatase (HAD superfamily)